jgi:signal transduction histidine kinase
MELFFGVLVIVSISNYGLLVMAEDNAAKQHAWILRAHSALEISEHLLRHLIDSETGQRGFLITHDENYLEPYKIGITEVKSDFDRLKKLTQGDTLQQARLDEIHDLILNKLAELDRTIQLSIQGKNEEALAIVKSDLGKKIMDSIRRLFTELKSEENRLLELQKAEYEKGQDLLKAIFIAETMLLIFLIIVIGLHIKRTLVRPLSDLTQSCITMTGTDDRDVDRSTKGNIDEIDQLKDAFNNMRQKVQERTSELISATQAAYDANQAKSEFLANMSHELRTPMHAILSFAAMGEEKIDQADKEKLQCYFSRVRESGERLLTLLNDLLDLSKLEARGMDFDFQRHDLLKVVDTAKTELSELARKKSLLLEVIPPDGDTVAIFDQNRVLQVMRNLLSNALKFTPEGKEIRVSFAPATLPAGRRISDSGELPALAVSVTDQGVGIPEDELEKVFDKFIQSTKTKTGGGGTGLGLAICKEIIEGHAGTIMAGNNPGGGAVFTFVIPRQTIQGTAVLAFDPSI